MHLLQVGIDIRLSLLGHESPVTTGLYVEADVTMKERALPMLQEPEANSLLSWIDAPIRCGNLKLFLERRIECSPSLLNILVRNEVLQPQFSIRLRCRSK